MYDPILITLSIVIIPVISVLVLYLVIRKKKQKKDLWFMLGFLCVTLFYIFASDPSLIYKEYVLSGDLTPIIIFNAIGCVFLLLAVLIFKKHRS